MRLGPARAALGGKSKQPSLDLNFLTGVVDPRIAFSRTGAGATYYDATGTLQAANSNVPRIDYGASPGGTTNWHPNSSAIGSTPGTPGVMPTGWAFSTGTLGLTRTVGTVSVVNGIPVLSVTYSGTATASGSITCQMLTAHPAAAPGQTWTGSVYIQLVSGAIPHNTVLELDEIGAGGAFLAGTVPSVTVTSTLTRFSTTRTMGNALTQACRIVPQFTITSGDVVNFTVNIGSGQLEQGATMTALVPTSTGPANIGAVPLGLLIEEGRVNSAPNPRCEGAVVADGVQLVTNGDFGLNPINAAQSTTQNGWSWTIAGGTSTVTWNGSAAVLTPDGTNRAQLDTVLTTVAGRNYTVSFDIAGQVANLLVNGGVALSINTGTTPGQVANFTATGTSTTLSFGRVSGGTVTIDNVSVKWNGSGPTGWSLQALAGLSQTVVGFGYENGVPYLDYSIVGTATGTFYVYTNPLASTSAGSIWTYSAYARLVAGSVANATFSVGTQFTGGPGNLGTTFTPNSSPLATQRISVTATAGTGVTSINSAIGMTTAGAVSFTLRIGLPQLELGSFASTPILPAVGTPAVTTRGSDNALVTMASFGWQGLPASLVAEASVMSIPSVGLQGFCVLDDGGGLNRITYRNNTTNLGGMAYVVAGAATAQPNFPGTLTAGVTAKMGCSMLTTGVIGAMNGVGGTSASGAAPSGLTILRLGQNGLGSGFLNGWHRRLRVWPRALPAGELQAATT